MSNIFSVSIPVTPSLSYEAKISISELNSLVGQAADSLNPYSTNYRAELFDVLKKSEAWSVVHDLWPACRSLFPNCEDSLLARYVFGCFSRSHWRWIFYSAVYVHHAISANDVIALMYKAAQKPVPFDVFLFDETQVVPLGFQSFKLPKAVEFRYQLAQVFHRSSEIDLREVSCLCQSHIDSAWRHHHERKLQEFFDAVVIDKKFIKKLDSQDAKNLLLDVVSWMIYPLPFFKLFALQCGVASPKTIPLVIYVQLKSKLDQFINSLTSFDFVLANQIAPELRPLVNLNVQDLEQLNLEQLNFDWVHSAVSNEKTNEYVGFDSLSADSLDVVNKVLQHDVPSWCSLPLVEMADVVIDTDELRLHLPNAVLCTLACAKEGVTAKSRIKWSSVSWTTLLLFTPDNSVVTKWFNSRKSKECDTWDWFTLLESIQKTSPERLTTAHLGVKAYEFFVERHIGTSRWKALGANKLHKQWQRAIMSFLGNSNTDLKQVERLRFVAEFVFEHSESKTFNQDFNQLVLAGLPDHAVLDWQVSHPQSETVKRVLEFSEVNLRNRFVNQFIGSERWFKAGGEKLHAHLERDLSDIVATKLIDKTNVDFVRFAESIYKNQSQNMDLVLNLFLFFDRIGYKMKSLLAMTDTEVLNGLIEDEKIDRKTLLRKIAKSADCPRLKATALDCLIDDSWDDKTLIKEVVWRVVNNLNGLRVVNACSEEVRDLAKVIYASSNLIRLQTLLKDELKLDHYNSSQLLRLAADVLEDSAPFRAGCLSLLSLIGLDCAQWLKFVISRANWEAERGKRLDSLYHTWKLPKKSGGTRTVSTPHIALKLLQKTILSRVITPLGVHSSTFGFVPHRSISQNAERHVGKEIVATTDITNCFPSVSWKLVRNVLKRDLGGRLNNTALSLLLDICTSQGGLPIGAPTSPGLLNRVLYKTDQILTDAAKKRGCDYSRYADDLTFSGDHGAVELLGVAKGTLKRIGLALDVKKTNIFRRGRRQMCTGLVVNEKVAVPRALRRKMRAAVHAVENGREPCWHGRPDTIEGLNGRLSFLCGIQPEYGKVLKERLQYALDKQEKK